MNTFVSAFSSDLIQIMLSFTYAMILAPWNDPIYFILWLLLLELAYLSIFEFNPLSQLGIVSAYILGWIVGRQLLTCYIDPFIQNTDVWSGDEKPFDSSLDRVISMFRHILE